MRPLPFRLDPQDVLVSTAGLPDMHFVANRWLSTDETLAKDKQTYVTLYPDTGQDAGGGVHNYRIHVSDVWGEGRLLGWGWRVRAVQRVQYLAGVAVLQLCRLALSFRPIESLATQPSVRWPWCRFASTQHARCCVGDRGQRWYSQFMRYTIPYAPAPCGLFLGCLCFQVFTSDIKGAGTDANVTIIMFGSNGLNTGKVKLDSSKNNFERGTVRVRVGVGGRLTRLGGGLQGGIRPRALSSLSRQCLSCGPPPFPNRVVSYAHAHACRRTSSTTTTRTLATSWRWRLSTTTRASGPHGTAKRWSSLTRAPPPTSALRSRATGEQARVCVGYGASLLGVISLNCLERPVYG